MNIASLCASLAVVSTWLLAAAACGPAPSPAESPAAVPGAGAAVADTPVPADGQCNFVNYHHDEAKNAKGAGKCASDCDCDGMRSCAAGVCQGTARPAVLTKETCNTKEYHYRESWTPAGNGKCANDCECDGVRSCVSGACTGTAR